MTLLPPREVTHQILPALSQVVGYTVWPLAVLALARTSAGRRENWWPPKWWQESCACGGNGSFRFPRWDLW